MLYLKIQGGLGNQLYQMFFGYELSSILKREIIFDYTRLVDGRGKFDEKQKHATILAINSYGLLESKFKKWENLGWEKKEDFHFFTEPRVTDTQNYIDFWFNINKKIEELKTVDINKPIYVDGHWQSYSYDPKKIDYFKRYLNQIEATDSQIKYEIETSDISCCINIRRGDYLTHYKGFFHECTMENYFNDAIELVDRYYEKQNKKVQYFIFSNDLDWCNENFKGENMRIVDHSFAGENFVEYLDLMRRCDSFIIPNSTFAIWAVITARNIDSMNRKGHSRIVVAPTKWYESNNSIPNPLTHSIAKYETINWKII